MRSPYRRGLLLMKPKFIALVVVIILVLIFLIQNTILTLYFGAKTTLLLNPELLNWRNFRCYNLGDIT